jgi:hypothetical protein
MLYVISSIVSDSYEIDPKEFVQMRAVLSVRTF